MKNLKDVEDFIAQNPDISDLGRPASDELVQKAERFLGLEFPKDYRAFLRRWGTLAIGPLEFYGITGDNFESSAIPNAIWFTGVKRQQVDLPREYVIIYDNDGDEYYCLDTSDPSKSRVVVWDVPSRRVRAVKSDSLFDFILTEADEVV